MDIVLFDFTACIRQLCAMPDKLAMLACRRVLETTVTMFGIAVIVITDMVATTLSSAR